MLSNFSKLKICNNRRDLLRSMQIFIRSEYVTTANVEIDQRTTFEGAMRIFKREVNNSNIVNEMKRRRYHEEPWMMRRRKVKERTMKAKFYRNVMTFDDKNPLADSTVFAQEYGVDETRIITVATSGG